jgi:hypothetical protein
MVLKGWQRAIDDERLHYLLILLTNYTLTAYVLSCDHLEVWAGHPI